MTDDQEITLQNYNHKTFVQNTQITFRLLVKNRG